MRVTATGRRGGAITRSPAALGLRRTRSQAPRRPRSTTAMALTRTRTARLCPGAIEAQLQIMPTIVPLAQSTMRTVPSPPALTRGAAGRENRHMMTSRPQGHRTLPPMAGEARTTASMVGDLHTLDEAPRLVAATHTLGLPLPATAPPPLTTPSTALRMAAVPPPPATPGTALSLPIRSGIEALLPPLHGEG